MDVLSDDTRQHDGCSSISLEIACLLTCVTLVKIRPHFSTNSCKKIKILQRVHHFFIYIYTLCVFLCSALSAVDMREDKDCWCYLLIEFVNMKYSVFPLAP